MKKLTTLTASLLLAQASLANVAAPAAPGVTTLPQNSAQWVERMTDFTRNASAYRDPKVFVPWANAVTEPGFYTQMGVNMMDPGNWLRMTGTMIDPRSMANYMQFAEPDMYMMWLGASLDPNFYTALLTQFSDPNKMMRWMMMPMDPNMWNMGMQAMNPGMYLKWMMSPMDPRAMSLMTAPINPSLYTSWMGQSMNPATYGSWGSFISPASMTAPVAGAAAAAPAPVGAYNPFDLTSVFNMFGQPAAAPATAPAINQTAAPSYNLNFFDPNAWTKMFALPVAPVTAPVAPTR